jgi:RND family efflux transporter MFP subunit
MANEDLSKLKIEKSSRFKQSSGQKKILYGGVAIALILLVIILYMGGVIARSVSVEAVSVSRIYPAQTFSSLNASGYVVAQRKAAVASKITGRLVSLLVSEGSRVKKGQIIARLENEDAVAAREQAKANRTVAQANIEQAKAEMTEVMLAFNRNKRLIVNGSISKMEYENSEIRYNRSKAAVSSAEASLKAATAGLQAATVAEEYALIKAPFDAVVLTKNADIGDIVTPLGAAANAKAAVVTIADMNSMEVEADVSESRLYLLKVGQPCQIQLDALPDSRFRGVIRTIVPTADRAKATVMVKVGFVDSDPRILPEMSAKVAFLSRLVKPDEMKPRTVIHSGALVTRGNKQIAFLITGNQVVEAPVQAGEAFGEFVEVVSGLKEGDRVVIKPLKELKNGTKIKLAEK